MYMYIFFPQIFVQFPGNASNYGETRHSAYTQSGREAQKLKLKK